MMVVSSSLIKPLAFLSTIYSRSSLALLRSSSVVGSATWTRRSAVSFLGICNTAWMVSYNGIARPVRAQESLDRRGLSSSTTSTSATTTCTMASTDAAATTGGGPLQDVTGYLDAESAAALDQELMSELGFSLEQLMELAGLSVAQAVYQVVQEQSEEQRKKKILLVCGPGNNGGDGLVAARHLVLFGYPCHVVYPKQSKKQHFVNLVQQCRDVGVEISSEMPAVDGAALSDNYSTIVDAIFGFSFHGEPREPFATILKQIIEAQRQHGVLTVAVDVPSGWNVDLGDVANTGFVPDAVISLTAPKTCMRQYPGRHFVGGRFLPPALAEKYGARMPPYPGTSQVMEVANK